MGSGFRKPSSASVQLQTDQFHPFSHCVVGLRVLHFKELRPPRPTFSLTSKNTLNKHHRKGKKEKKKLFKSQFSDFRGKVGNRILNSGLRSSPARLWRAVFSHSAMRVHHILSPQGRGSVHLYINRGRRFLGQIKPLLH